MFSPLLVLSEASDSAPLIPRFEFVVILTHSLPSSGSRALVSYATIPAVAPDEAVASTPMYAPAIGNQNAAVPSLPAKILVSLS